MTPLPPPRCLAVDVDHTLIRQGRPDLGVVTLIRERAADGWDVVVWSMRGRHYAQNAANVCGIAALVVCVGKPGVILDDQGLDWLRGAQVVRPAARVSAPGRTPLWP